MKKLLMFLCAITLVFGMVGSASALSYSNELSFNSPLEGLESSNSGIYECAWTHDTFPENYWGFPVDIVYAELEIKGFVEGDDEDPEEFELEWTIDGTSVLDGNFENIFDVSGIWGNSFDLVLSSINNITVLSSKLTLECEKVEPVPEPSTILLLGTGLLGLVGYNRKRFSKKS